MEANIIKVLFITYTHSNGGGAEKVLTTLVNNLDKNKYKITIQEISRFNKKKEKIDSNIKLKKYPVIYSKKVLNCLSDANYYFLYNYPEVLRTIYKWTGYDVIISWNYQLPSFALMGFDDELTISHFHGAVDDLNIKKYPLRTKDFLKQRKVWEKVDLITTISQYSRESALNICPELRDKIQIIYNGTSVDEIKREANEYIPDVIIPNDYINLISISRLDDNKNISLVLKALSILKSENVKFNYYIVGDGEERDNLIAQTKELSIEDSVYFLGFVENPMPILKNCDILCLSSFSEGWPTVITEAMSLNKPFISTPVAGAKDELSDDNNCGIVVDFDPENYAKQLKKLINDSELRIRLGENGFKNINKYSIDSMVCSFEKIFDSNCLKNNNVNKVKHNAFLNYIKYISFICVGIPYFYKNVSYIFEHKNRYNILKKHIELFAILYRCVILIINILLTPILIVPRALCAIIYCIMIGVDK